MNRTTQAQSRRSFILSAGVGACAYLGGCSGKTAVTGRGDDKETDVSQKEVSPAEDLMREHGVLDRVLLVYEEGLRRLEGNEDLPPDVIVRGADIVRRFIEDYHEKLEEEFLFPRFERAGKLTDLVAILRAQHGAGRSITESIQRISTVASLRTEASRQQVQDSIRSFIRMYRPHAAREDTVLFPALHSLVSRHEYDALGEEFEDRERGLFGQGGFEAIVEEVAGLERSLGIDDLARFTPTR